MDFCIFYLANANKIDLYHKNYQSCSWYMHLLFFLCNDMALLHLNVSLQERVNSHALSVHWKDTMHIRALNALQLSHSLPFYPLMHSVVTKCMSIIDMQFCQYFEWKLNIIKFFIFPWILAIIWVQCCKKGLIITLLYSRTKLKIKFFKCRTLRI